MAYLLHNVLLVFIPLTICYFRISRGHLGPILSLSISPSGDYLFSGGLDKTIRCWTMPSANIDPYDSYDPSILSLTLTGTQIIRPIPPQHVLDLFSHIFFFS